jgi:hypothetical protein
MYAGHSAAAPPPKTPRSWSWRRRCRKARSSKFWTSDADDAIERAGMVSGETMREPREAGVAASGDTGESDPLDAIQDALQTFPADRILVFSRSDSEETYREDVDPEQIEERFGVPVTVASVSGRAPRT